MKDRRQLTDRRSYNTKQEQAYPNNRRRFPDRRLNNILAEWVPINRVHTHPATGSVFTNFLNRLLKRG
jgi:hypothetical protein